jgi:DNA-binding NarL/FixJ family response regulator
MENFGDETRQNQQASRSGADTDHAKTDLSDKSPEKTGLASLSPRERDILEAIIAGETSKETARRLALSPRTVEVHRAHILKKLGARNTADLLRRVLLDQAKS